MDKLISLQDAIKAIDEKAKRIKNEDTLNGLAGAVGILFDLPSVKPQPETGRWIFEGNQLFSCSSCGQIYTQKAFEYLKLHKDDSDFPNYCPNCGARMIDAQESEDKE